MSTARIRQRIKEGIRNNVLILLILFVLSLFSACGAVQAGTQESGRVRLVATTTLLADLASSIGGEAIEVSGLMGPGLDPHQYQASAGDVTTLQQADIVLYNGLHLEGKMGDVFAALEGSGKAVICAADGIDPALLMASENDASIPDPHVWFDVSIWEQAAIHLSAQLSKLDPEHQALYAQNLTTYRQELAQVDTYIHQRAEELPKEQRVLVTAHDAFRYFGNAYGFQVLGLQGISTDAEAGTADVSAMADYIAEHRIGAVFVESSVPPKTIEALQAAVKARGFETAIGGELYSDSLGGPGSGAETYRTTFTQNIDTIVDALKGNKQ